MKKSFLFLALLLPLFFASCEKNNGNEPIIEQKVDQRLKFVGQYSLNVTGEMKYYYKNGKESVVKLSKSNQDFQIALDPYNDNKVKISGYYGNLSGEILNGKISVDIDKDKGVVDGSYVETLLTTGDISMSGNRLEWESVALMTLIGSSNTSMITSTTKNVATKK